MEDVEYFSQYVRGYADICKKAEKGILPETTEDSCYLCKDGGKLIECDNNLRCKTRCRKVYHEYCLNYTTKIRTNKEWVCPRHYCDMCGSVGKRDAHTHLCYSRLGHSPLVVLFSLISFLSDDYYCFH